MSLVTFLPVLPHQGFLIFRVINSRSLFHLQHAFYLRKIVACCIDRLNPQPKAVVKFLATFDTG